MHIAVSWDINAKEPRWGQLNEQMRKGLSGFSWVRPLTTFYIVKVAGEADRSIVLDRLTSIAKGAPVHVVVSPVMSGGRYNGFLPKDMWAKINERTG